MLSRLLKKEEINRFKLDNNSYQKFVKRNFCNYPWRFYKNGQKLLREDRYNSQCISNHDKNRTYFFHRFTEAFTLSRTVRSFSFENDSQPHSNYTTVQAIRLTHILKYTKLREALYFHRDYQNVRRTSLYPPSIPAHPLAIPRCCLVFGNW